MAILLIRKPLKQLIVAVEEVTAKAEPRVKFGKGIDQHGSYSVIHVNWMNVLSFPPTIKEEDPTHSFYELLVILRKTVSTLYSTFSKM